MQESVDWVRVKRRTAVLSSPYVSRRAGVLMRTRWNNPWDVLLKRSSHISSPICQVAGKSIRDGTYLCIVQIQLRSLQV